jgi:MipA family protein
LHQHPIKRHVNLQFIFEIKKCTLQQSLSIMKYRILSGPHLHLFKGSFMNHLTHLPCRLVGETHHCLPRFALLETHHCLPRSALLETHTCLPRFALLETRSISKRFAFAIAGLLFTQLAVADAAEEKSYSGYAVLGAISIPEFEGAQDQSTQPLIATEIRWGQRYLAWEGTSGRFNLLNQANWEFGPAINITFARDKDIEALRVRKLGEIDEAFEAGVFVAYNIANVLNDRDTLRFSAQVLKDISDTHEGTIGELSASYRMRVTDRLSITNTSSFSFANDDYANTYFSVTPAGALASGLAATKTDGGNKDAAISLAVNYSINERWMLFGYGKFARLLGDFADSPIVAIEGDKNQVSAGFGVGWTF